MAIIEYIGGTIKCKDCKHFKAVYKGKRKLHKCTRNGGIDDKPGGMSVTTKSKACDHFKPYWT